MKPRKPGTETAGAAFSAKRIVPRDDPDARPKPKIANDIAARPRKAPEKEDGKIAMSALTLKRVDAAVTGAKLNIQGRVVRVNAGIANQGNADLHGTVIIQLRNGRRHVVGTIRESVRLAAGDSRIIKKHFRVGKAKRFIANIAVSTPNDANSQNNKKKVRALR